jgi:MFS family permease
MSGDANAGGVAVLATLREAPLAVKTLLGGVLINRLSGFLNIFLVLYLAAKGYSASQATLALGIYGVGAIIGVLIGGALADQLGARTATVLSMASSSVLVALLLVLPNYGLLLLAVALVGVAGQIYRPASAALLSALTPADRQVMVFAMYRFCLNLGAMAAPLLGFALYNLDSQGYTLLFLGEALVALAYAVLAALTLPAGSPAHVDGESEPASASAASYLEVLADRRFVLYLVAMLVHSMVYVQYLSTLPLDVAASGIPVLWYTLAVALNGFMVIAFELLVTKVSQTWPHRVPIGLAFGLLGAGVAFYGLPPGPAIVLVGTFIWSLGEIIGGPTIFAYPAIAGPARLKSRYIGSFQFVFGVGSALGPMLGGWLFVRLGHGVWPVMASLSIVATVLGVFAVQARRPAPDDRSPAMATEPRAASTVA